MKSRLFGKAAGTLGLDKDTRYRVLDFGCGDGGFLGLLSRAVGEGSRLVGYDSMGKSIAAARARHPGVEFICERFDSELPFAGGAFDIVVTIDTIECIRDKSALLDEIHRVLRPGGQVLAMHWDWDTATYNIETRELARKAVRAFSDWKQPWMDEADGQMGRRLWGLFEGSGKFHGTPDTFTLIETQYEEGRYGYDRAQDLSALAGQGGFDKDDYERFRRELSESSERREYFHSVTSFIYHGLRV